MPPRSERLLHINSFKVMELLARANELQADGVDVIHMEVGEPDFPTPAAVVAAAQAAIDKGLTRYTDARGLPELRVAISQHYQDTYRLDVDPSRIFVTAGGSGALLLAMAALVNPGDGWLLTDPGYPCNKNFIATFGGVPQSMIVGPDTNYQPSAKTVSDHWRQDTCGLILASPANPTGAMIGPRAFKQIYDVAESHGGQLLVDEIYHGMTYGNTAVYSALELASNVLVVNSFSKCFGMTGWRLGWMVVPEDLVDALQKLAQNLFICPSSIAQYAALAAFGADARREMEANRLTLEGRRNFLVPALKQAGFEIAGVPDGAFYIYARIPEHCESSEQLSAELLEKHHLAITPGTDFGTFEADRHVRFSYAQSLARLEEAVSRIGQALC